MKKRLIIATAVAGVLLIAFMGVGGLAGNPESVAVTASYTPTIDFAMSSIPIAFGAIIPDDATTATVTSGVTLKSNTEWKLMLTTAPNLVGSGTAAGYTIDDANFTFMQDNPVGAGTVFDQAGGVSVGFQTAKAAGADPGRIAHGTRGVKTWDINFELFKSFDIYAGPYALDAGGFQVYTVVAI